MHILMLHGVNHNMFGKRDPVQYGTRTLFDIDDRLRADVTRPTNRTRLPPPVSMASFFSLSALLWWLPASAAHAV